MIFATALVLGGAADALTAEGLHSGIGMTLALLLLLASLAGVGRLPGFGVESRWRWSIIAAMAILASAFAWRTSPDLLGMNAFALFVAAILLSVRVTGRRLPEVRMSEFAVASMELPLTGIARTGQAARRTFARRSGAEPAGDRSWLRAHGRDVLIGIAIALPVLGIFTALLASADASFARLVTTLFSWNVEDVLLHATIVTIASFACGAFLLSVLTSVPMRRQDEPRSHWAGPAVVWIVLGSTVALFGIFAALQAGYLFGGADFLDGADGLSAAAYGRRGFFELTIVAALVVPLILAFRSWHADTAAGARAFRVTAPALAALTLLLQASAVSRMWIYQDRFGLSEQRVYATVILVWVAAGITWIGVRIALDRAPQLAAFAAATGITLVIVMDVANPAAVIARTNMTRSGDAPIDLTYLVDLGPDALPTILDHSDQLSDVERRKLELELRRVDATNPDDWRGWNLSRDRADEARAANRGPRPS